MQTLIKIGDTLLLEGFTFRVMRMSETRAGLAYTDVEGVTHIRWVNRAALLELLYGAA